MNKSFFYLLIFLLSALFAFTGCDTRDDEMNEMDRMEGQNETMMEDTDDRKVFLVRDRDYTYDERNEWRTNIDNAVNEIDREIQRLEAEAANAEGEAKEQYNQAIADLRERKNELISSLMGFTVLTVS